MAGRRLPLVLAAGCGDRAGWLQWHALRRRAGRQFVWPSCRPPGAGSRSCGSPSPLGSRVGQPLPSQARRDRAQPGQSKSKSGQSQPGQSQIKRSCRPPRVPKPAASGRCQAPAAGPAAGTGDYRVTIKLPSVDPSAPAEALTKALRSAGLSFEVETIERVRPGASGQGPTGDAGAAAALMPRHPLSQRQARQLMDTAYLAAATALLWVALYYLPAAVALRFPGPALAPGPAATAPWLALCRGRGGGQRPVAGGPDANPAIRN
jgi:hypothetical protein